MSAQRGLQGTGGGSCAAWEAGAAARHICEPKGLCPRLRMGHIRGQHVGNSAGTHPSCAQTVLPLQAHLSKDSSSTWGCSPSCSKPSSSSAPSRFPLPSQPPACLEEMEMRTADPKESGLQGSMLLGDRRGPPSGPTTNPTLTSVRNGPQTKGNGSRIRGRS